MSTSWGARIQNQLLDVLDLDVAKYHEIHPTEALTLSLEEQPSATLIALTELAQLGDTSAVGLHTLGISCTLLLSLGTAIARMTGPNRADVQIRISPTPASILTCLQLRTLALVLLRRFVVRTAPNHEATQ